jgi:excisionase family DNA binding protein
VSATAGNAPYRTSSGTVVIPADVAGEVLAALIRDMTTRARRDGLLVSDQARRLLYALHEAAEEYDRAGPSVTGTVLAEPATLGPEVMVTVREAAAALECSPRWVRRLVAAGRLRARRSGRVLLVHAGDLQTYRKGARAT